MKRFLLFLTALPLMMVSCAKAEMEDPCEGSSAIDVRISTSELEDDSPSGKAVISDYGFSWKVNDILSWISSTGGATPYQLKSGDIQGTSGNIAKFNASIPGLGSGDVQGYFSYNIGGDNAVYYTKGNLSGNTLTVAQDKAGTINPDYLFMFSSTGYETIRKGSTSVNLTVRMAGGILAIRPFSQKYCDEDVQSVEIASTNDFAGTVVYNHATSKAGSISSAKASSYKVCLATPFSLSSVSDKTKSSSIFFSVPAGSISSYKIIVTTDAATYTFTASKALEVKENHKIDIPVNLDKAVRATRTAMRQLTLTENMIDTNAPMFPATFLQGADQYGFGGSPNWVSWIGSAGSPDYSKGVNRTVKYARAANMWDNDASTCYHTNVDHYFIGGTSWGSPRKYDDGSVVAVSGHYIQVNLGSTYDAVKVKVKNCADGGYFDKGYFVYTSSNGSSFSKKESVACAGSGKEASSSEISGTVSNLRIMPDGTTDNAESLMESANWNNNGPAFGIAELTVWVGDGGSSEVKVTGVSLNKSSLSIDAGSSSSLVAAVSPSDASNKAVTWDSSDKSVATVSGGIVTGLKEGTSTITVKTVDGGYTAKCSVTVTESGDDDLVEIELTPDLVSTNAPMEYVTQGKNPDACGFGSGDWFTGISEGQTNARRAKYGKVENMWDSNSTTCYHTNLDWGKSGTSWQSRSSGPFVNDYIQINLPGIHNGVKMKFTACDDAICDMSQGIQVYYSSDGSVFTLDGTYKLSGKVFTVDKIGSGSPVCAIKFVNVKKCDWNGTESAFGCAELELWSYGKLPGIPVTGVSLNTNSATVYKGNTVTLTASVKPSNASNKSISWSTSNPSVATVSNGVVTAKAVGSADITVTTADGGYTAKCRITVEEVGGYPVGVTVVQDIANDFAYALIDFKKNPRLNFNVSYIAGGAGLTKHFNNLSSVKGTPIIATNADFFWNNGGYLLSCDLVMTGSSIKQYPAICPDGSHYPARAALGRNVDGSFEINWVRGPSNCAELYAYPAPYPYASDEAASSPSTGRWWWWPVEAIGGGPVIVDGGKNVSTNNYNLECQSFSGGTTSYKTSKTCYGFRADGVMVILVEGYITLSTAADRMIELGCVKAINFDGGGSSEMLGPGAKAIRKQTDTYERSIPSAIIISEK